MKNNLWLIWRNPTDRLRYRVGLLSYNGKSYRFQYTDPELNDAVTAGFDYFPGFNERQIYTSTLLFPNIKSRLPNPHRPDYLDMMNEYDLTDNASDWEILTATKGRLITDDYEFVRPFTLDKIEFDIAGTRHRDDYPNFEKVLSVNDKVQLEPEPDNKYDANAIKIKLNKNGNEYHLGYVPRFYSKQLSDFLNDDHKYSAMIKKIQLGGNTHDNDITAEVQLIFKKD